MTLDVYAHATVIRTQRRPRSGRCCTPVSRLLAIPAESADFLVIKRQERAAGAN